MYQVGAGLRMLWLTQLFRRHPPHQQSRTSPRRGLRHLTPQHQICHPATKTEMHPHPRTTNPNLTHRSRQHVHHSHWWACPPRCRIGTSTTRRPHPHPQPSERNQPPAISPLHLLPMRAIGLESDIPRNPHRYPILGRQIHLLSGTRQAFRGTANPHARVLCRFHSGRAV